MLRFRRAAALLPPLPRFFVSFIFAWFDVFGSWFLVFSVFGFQGTPASLMLATGDGAIRTLDPLLARQVLSQLSYAPMVVAYRGFPRRLPGNAI